MTCKNSSVRFCIGFVIFAQLIGGLIFLVGLICFHVFSTDNDTPFKSIAQFLFYVFLVITLMGIASGILLFIGAVWRQPKRILEHFCLNSVIAIVIFVLFGLPFLHIRFDMELVNGALFFILPLLGFACIFEYVVYVFYQDMKKSRRDNNEYELYDSWR